MPKSAPKLEVLDSQAEMKASVVELLEMYLERAKRGEFVRAVVFVDCAEGDSVFELTRSRHMGDLLAVVGMLELTKLRVLQEITG